MNKKCKECELTKYYKDFYKNKNLKDGYFSKCIDCVRKDRKNNYNKNKDKIKESQKKYYKNNENKIKEYYKENKNKIKEYYKEYNKKNRNKIKEYYKENKNKIKEYYKEYYKENKNKIKEYNKENRNKINEYYKEKYNNNDEYKLYHLTRSRLNIYLKSKNINKNNNSTYDSIGLEPKLFNKWIQFNLEIDNLKDKKYHLDHVKPLSLSNCKNWEDIIQTKCNHWTNIIPTTPEYNLEKSDREPTNQELFKQELRVYIFSKNYINIKYF